MLLHYSPYPYHSHAEIRHVSIIHVFQSPKLTWHVMRRDGFIWRSTPQLQEQTQTRFPVATRAGLIAGVAPVISRFCIGMHAAHAG